MSRTVIVILTKTVLITYTQKYFIFKEINITLLKIEHKK
jgi:hypothetical protein